MPTGPRLYLGCRLPLLPGQQVPARDGFVDLTPNLDAAIWAAELAEGDGDPRVYVAAPTGTTEKVEGPPPDVPPHLAMSLRTREPVTVVDEVTDGMTPMTDLGVSLTDAAWVDEQTDGDGDGVGDICDPDPTGL